MPVRGESKKSTMENCKDDVTIEDLYAAPVSVPLACPACVLTCEEKEKLAADRAKYEFLDSLKASGTRKCAGIKHLEKIEAEAMKIITRAFHIYKPNEVMLSFNGGKDCTVLLNLLSCYLANKCTETVIIPVLYIEPEDPFEEVEEVVQACIAKYPIQLIRRKGVIKEVLTEVCNNMPYIRAVFMGCRRSDPYCATLGHMAACDPGWPAIVRINPLLDWTYRQIWHYIFMRDVPYCRLYNQGYTSLGMKSNTKPNPYLRVIDKKTGKILSYRHASELEQEEFERAGREPQVISPKGCCDSPAAS